MENFKLRLDQILKNFDYTTFKPSGVQTAQTTNYARSNDNAGLSAAFAIILADLKEANAEARRKYADRKAQILAALNGLGIKTTEQVGRKMTVTDKKWYSLMMEDAMKGYSFETAYSYYVIETIRRIERNSLMVSTIRPIWTGRPKKPLPSSPKRPPCCLIWLVPCLMKPMLPSNQ